MMENNYWIPEGTHVVMVSDYHEGEHQNAMKSRFINFRLEDDAGRICNKRFLITPASKRAIRSFGFACGLKPIQMRTRWQEMIIGCRVEIDVVMNDDGYPDAVRWRRAPDEPVASGTREPDEGLLF